MRSAKREQGLLLKLESDSYLRTFGRNSRTVNAMPTKLVVGTVPPLIMIMLMIMLIIVVIIVIAYPDQAGHTSHPKHPKHHRSTSD